MGGGKRRTRGGGKRPTTGAGRNKHLQNSKWCSNIEKDVKEGRLHPNLLQVSNDDPRWNTDLDKWVNVCNDPTGSKLEKLGNIGRPIRNANSARYLKAIIKDIQARKYLSEEDKKNINQIKTAKKASDRWTVIKKVCVLFCKQLDAARKEKGANPHIEVWNGKTAKTLHNFLGNANKGLEKVKTALDLYNAFAAFKRVDPKTAATNPKAYAASMGNALRAVGVLLKALPAPLNAYGEFLSKSGTFFVDMSYKLIPGQRKNFRDYAPGGKFYSPYDRVFTG